MSDCILGRGLQGNGYARVTIGGERKLAHRVVWEQEYGPISSDHHVHHRCGNRACVNVEHLELLTAVEHTKLHNPPLAEPKCGHGPDSWQTRSDGKRDCRVCHREQMNERWRTNFEHRERRAAYKRRWREARRAMGGRVT